MRCYLFILITIFVMNLQCVEEISSEPYIINCYEKLCDHIQGEFLADEQLLECYSALIGNRKILSSYMKNKDLDKMESNEASSYVIVAGIFKLNDLKDEIEAYNSFDGLLLNSKIFYYYQIYGSNNHLDILKDYSSMVIENSDVFMMEMKIHSIDLLGWTCDRRILEFLTTLNTNDLDGYFGEIVYESLHRLELLLENKSE